MQDLSENRGGKVKPRADPGFRPWTASFHIPHSATPQDGFNLQQGWPECYLVFYWAGLQDTPWLQWEFYEDKDLFQ